MQRRQCNVVQCSLGLLTKIVLYGLRNIEQIKVLYLLIFFVEM
jgi:hypothetical protein